MKSNIRKVFLIFIVALLVYFFVSLKLAVPDILAKVNFLRDFLTSKTLSDLLLGLSLSLIAACIFYVFIDYWPRRERQVHAESFLEKQASVILHAYKESKWFAHEMSALHVPNEFNEQWLTEQIKTLKDKNHPKKEQLFLQLKCAVDAAYSQKNEMRTLLTVAANLSEDHAVAWLNIITKIRLFAEEYERIVLEPHLEAEYYGDGEAVSFKEVDGKKSISQLTLSCRQFRMLEYCEACLEWYRLVNRNRARVHKN